MMRSSRSKRVEGVGVGGVGIAGERRRRRIMTATLQQQQQQIQQQSKEDENNKHPLSRHRRRRSILNISARMTSKSSSSSLSSIPRTAAANGTSSTLNATFPSVSAYTEMATSSTPTTAATMLTQKLWKVLRILLTFNLCYVCIKFVLSSSSQQHIRLTTEAAVHSWNMKSSGIISDNSNNSNSNTGSSIKGNNIPNKQQQHYNEMLERIHQLTTGGEGGGGDEILKRSLDNNNGGTGEMSLNCPDPLVPFLDIISDPYNNNNDNDNSDGDIVQNGLRGTTTAAAAAGSSQPLIPRILHVSLTSRCLPQELYSNIMEWKKALPAGYSIFFHDEDAVDRLIYSYRVWHEFPHLIELMKNCVKPTGMMKMDIWRILVIYEFGGIYTDIENIPLEQFGIDAKSLLEDPNDLTAFFFQDSLSRPSSWFFAMEPRHPILLFTMQFILESVYQIKDVSSNRGIFATGPNMLKKGYSRFLNGLLYDNASSSSSSSSSSIMTTTSGGNSGKAQIMTGTDGKRIKIMTGPVIGGIQNNNNNGDNNVHSSPYIQIQGGPGYYTELVSHPFHPGLTVTRHERVELLIQRANQYKQEQEEQQQEELMKNNNNGDGIIKKSKTVELYKASCQQMLMNQH